MQAEYRRTHWFNTDPSVALFFMQNSKKGDKFENFDSTVRTTVPGNCWVSIFFFSDRGKGFIDILDAQWECEGELIPLNLSVLNPREFLVYQHGLFLMHTLHNLKLVGTKMFLLL